jgi:sigma-B regulation protein RsbU (phosphoserine phosphatase)
MKTKLPLYLIAAVLFLFTAATLVVHFSYMPTRMRDAASPAVAPFTYNGKVTRVPPDSEAAGLRIGDKILTMNGRPLDSNDVFFGEIENSAASGSLALTVRREGSDEPVALNLPITAVEKNFEYYSKQVLAFLYSFFIPAFCALIGFYVVAVRIEDPLAWLLLLVMLGFSSIGLQWGGSIPIISVYTQVFFSTWALSMFLFAVYFPERLTLDARFPWLKYLIIVPLGVQGFFTLVNVFRRLTGWEIPDLAAMLGGAANTIALVSNMAAISLFFAILGYKSGTIENPDARRRLKMMVIGTSVAMGPSFILLIHGLITGAPTGTFYDRVPYPVAFVALMLMLIFPISLAYVIVVHRAMDVSVAVRQGLQYALATKGIRVLQFAMLLAIGLGVRWFINNFGFATWVQVLIIVAGISMVPLIDLAARHLRVWIDRRFFREAYNAEQILSDLSDDVRTMVETKPLLETVAGTISESLHVPQVTMLVKEGDAFVPAYSLGFDTEPRVALSGTSRAMRKLADNKPIVFYDDMTEVTSTPTMSLSDREQLIELNSQVLLPVTAKKNLSGIISLSPKRSEEPYTPSDLRLLRSVASQTGLALENSRLSEAIVREAAQKERLNTELEIAREVQERLFPQELPRVNELDIYGACRPALGVGGDYYDFLELADGKLGIAIGDISGKGVGASLMMASLQASLRGQTIHFGDDLAALMAQVNALVYEASTTNRYATFFYAQYDPSSSKLSYVNAGHNPPFLLRANGEVETLTEGGPVVGMLPPMIVDYSQGSVGLASGDLLVGFTDGISEAMNPDEEEWGEDAMLARLKEIRHESAEDILRLIVASADEFASGAKQHDDMTMIVVKVN